MDTKLDVKITNRLKAWELARKKKDEFVGRKLEIGGSFAGKDPFELALAYANEQRAWVYYELAESEAYPEEYTKEKIDFLNREKERLNKRVRALKERQWPTRD